jgi:3D-(3,5/4)-trihydroxycyclohexane-1,2-dione acylhydrolase (decyclizing)
MGEVPRQHARRLEAMQERAGAIAKAGGLQKAISSHALAQEVSTTVSEGLVLGLLKQGVRKYLALFGHGSTDLAEVLRVYDAAGVTRTYNFRHETAMAHAATALKWQYGETAAVVTSIGPGALQAFAGSLAAASNGIGVYHIYGDETTHGEGPNMQAIPKRVQGLFGQLTALMGESYVLHTPEALRAALRRGNQAVHRRYNARPFFFLLPLNVQSRSVRINLEGLPDAVPPPPAAVGDPEALAKAVELIKSHERIVVKIGGGGRHFPTEIRQLVREIGGVAVLSPGALGVLPDSDPQNMGVSGSKGSLSGNFATDHADLLITIGSRGVCQADCSGTAYGSVDAVVNINADLTDVTHYNRTVALAGDIGVVTNQLLAVIGQNGGTGQKRSATWLEMTAAKKREWATFKSERYARPTLFDDVWRRPVLTQPAAIKIAADFANEIGATKYFDAGDVQAIGFQVVEDEHPGQTITETGASYMGFAVSAVLAAALADRPRLSIAFSGDGSFFMNPQALVDGVEHGARGIILLLDNRRMAAISGLQEAQYGQAFRTSDSVAVNYLRFGAVIPGLQCFDGGTTIAALRDALTTAAEHDGLSLVHVPVYYGPDPLGGLGAYGIWNVGNWCEDVQARYHQQSI